VNTRADTLTPVHPGERLHAATINALQDAIRRGPSRRMRLPDLPDPRPWDWLAYAADTLTVTLRKGYIEVHHDAGTLYLTTSDGENPTVTLSDGTNYVVAEVELPVETGTPPTYALAAYATLAACGSDADTYRKLLWMFDVDVYSVVDSVRYCAHNPEPPAWRPDDET
jgi:hypothetical protein